MILDKAKMAHDYAIEMLKRGDPERSIAFDAWTLADTMQAEADKRVVKFPDVFFDTKPNEEWQPDWSQAPDEANYWAMDKDSSANFFRNKPEITNGNGWDFGGVMQSNNAHKYTGNWQNSLRRRPQ